MIVIVRPLSELLVRLSSSPQSRRRPLYISCDTLIVGHATSSRTEPKRRRVHEVLAVGPRVRVVQHVAARACWRLCTRSRCRTLSLWRVVDVAPRTVRSVALPWPQSFCHHLSFSPTRIIPRTIGCVTRSARPIPTRRDGWPLSLAIRRLALP